MFRPRGDRGCVRPAPVQELVSMTAELPRPPEPPGRQRGQSRPRVPCQMLRHPSLAADSARSGPGMGAVMRQLRLGLCTAQAFCALVRLGHRGGFRACLPWRPRTAVNSRAEALAIPASSAGPWCPRRTTCHLDGRPGSPSCLPVSRSTLVSACPGVMLLAPVHCPTGPVAGTRLRLAVTGGGWRSPRAASDAGTAVRGSSPVRARRAPDSGHERGSSG